MIIHCTISPCDHERRIFNEVLTASRNGSRVEIVALKTPEVPGHSHVEGNGIHRIAVKHWKGGPLKFLSFNWKLFRYLRTHSADVIHAHDLWVLPAAATAARLKGCPLIYDAHEYYTDLEIFQQRRFTRWLWISAERFFIRKIAVLIAINDFHRRLYLQAYPSIKKSVTLMNLPSEKEKLSEGKPAGFYDREKVVIFQGIFKPRRGLTQMIQAMEKVKEGKMWLLGYGELEDYIRGLVREKELQEKVAFYEKQPVDRVLALTRQARAGLVLFEAHTANYRYASPNKFFEYVMAGTPVIASDIPTFRQFMTDFEVGILVDPDSPLQISEAISALLGNQELWQRYHDNCLLARETWNWEKQEIKLLEMYREIDS